MSDSEENSGFEIRRSFRVVRMRRWLILIVTVVVLGAMVTLALLTTPKYSATAKIVFVKSRASALSATADPQSLNPARDIQTEVEVLTSNSVRQMVAASLHVRMAPLVSVTAVADTDAIKIAATSSDPRRAALIANDYAETYLKYKHDQFTASLQTVGLVVQSRIKALQDQIDALNAQVVAAAVAQRPAVESTISPQRDALISQQTALQQQLDQSQVEATLSDNAIQIGDRAAVPGSPSSPKPLKSAAYGLVLGLCLGIALALLLEYLDDSIRTKGDAEAAAGGADTLGVIPVVPGWKAKDGPLLVSLRDPSSPAAEAYRGLRTAIRFLGAGQPLHVVQVTSPSAGEGKTTTLVNLAIALGDAGQRVCVVCADLRRPRAHQFLDLPNEPGLTSVAQGAVSLDDAIRPVPSIPDIYLLGSGPLPAKPSELLASSFCGNLLDVLSKRFDVVLVDSPPVLPVTDAAALARYVDGILLVSRAGMTKQRALTRAVEVLEQVGAPILGLVLNGASEELEYGYGYHYRSYEASQPAQPPRPPRSPDNATAANGRGDADPSRPEQPAVEKTNGTKTAAGIAPRRTDRHR